MTSQTAPTKLPLLPRALAGAPLLFFGVMHLSGAMPMRPLVEAAGFPMPAAMAVAAPLAQILAGLLLLAGALARAGAVVAIGTMLGAILTHIRIPNDQWPMPTPTDPNAVGVEPSFMIGLAAMVIVCALVVVIKGAGAVSIDSRTRIPADS